ncbi:hypothetical protein D3C71_1618660 [compost metagenome]
MNGFAAVVVIIAKSRLPPTRSVSSGAVPRYGIWLMNRPPRFFSSSPAKCRVEPTPELP